MGGLDNIRTIAIVSGVEAELAAFLPDQSREQIAFGNMMAQRLTYAGKNILLMCAGIGKVAAATAATALCAYGHAELLVVVGTAGKIGDAPGDLFLIAQAFQSDFGAQRDDGFVHYTAGSWPIGPAVIEAFTAHPLPDCPLPRARMATGDMFVESGIHAERLRMGLDVQLVDMETAAVAHSAALLGVPWIAVKATTDDANGDSAGSFVDNLHRAARSAALAVEDIISGL